VSESHLFSIIISTAFSGASSIVYGTNSLIKGETLADIMLRIAFGSSYRHSEILNLVIIILAMMGIIYQYKTNVSKTTEIRSVKAEYTTADFDNGVDENT